MNGTLQGIEDAQCAASNRQRKGDAAMTDLLAEVHDLRDRISRLEGQLDRLLGVIMRGRDQ